MCVNRMKQITYEEVIVENIRFRNPIENIMICPIGLIPAFVFPVSLLIFGPHVLVDSWSIILRMKLGVSRGLGAQHLCA